MHFASPIPWWLAVLIVAGIASLARFAYARPVVPITRAQRGVLVALRALTLSAIAFFVCRPVLLLPPTAAGDIVVPVLVDASRSMRTPDADGASRMAQATALVRTTLLPRLSAQAKVELFGFSDRVSPATLESLAATGSRTDIAGAVAAMRARYRGRPVAGIVVISDGADTGQSASGAVTEPGPPIFAVGVGSIDGLPDREVTGVTAGDPRLDQASVDLHVSASARGFGTAPFQLRVLANGQVVDTRRVTPAADGSPIDETFTVSPNSPVATVYRAEISADPQDAIPENNVRSLVVNPAGRKRRLLMLAGAPGYEHSFLLRALLQDSGFEVDSVVRKGKNDANQETFLVQAGGGRAAPLMLGFPATREALFGYDALVIANIEGEFFSRAQLTLVADFVGERGGGLLVLGGRSFERRGLIGTPIENVLPVELNDRRGGAVRPPSEEGPAPYDAVFLTEEGQRHPVMRIGASIEESRKLWATLPPLASSAAVGGPRPGASVLAVTAQASGVVLPVVAVQRYGRGRSMVFAGEGSWRWRMLLPAADRRFEFFWRQALRWLSTDAPDAVTVGVPPESDPGEPLTVEIEVRDRAFAPVQEASTEARLTLPGGQTKPLPVRPTGTGRFVATMVSETAGLYRLQVEARKAGASLGTAERWLYVGGTERELADPRLNEGFLRRIARDSGGQYVRAADVSTIVSVLENAVPQGAERVRRDLWHGPWPFALVIALLSAEWLLRRRWGLR